MDVFEKINRWTSALADYTVGTIIVMFHFVVADRDRLRDSARPRKRLATAGGE